MTPLTSNNPVAHTCERRSKTGGLSVEGVSLSLRGGRGAEKAMVGFPFFGFSFLFVDLRDLSIIIIILREAVPLSPIIGDHHTRIVREEHLSHHDTNMISLKFS